MNIDKHREPGATGDHRQADLVVHQATTQNSFGGFWSARSAKIHCILFSTPRIIECWSWAAEAAACKPGAAKDRKAHRICNPISHPIGNPIGHPISNPIGNPVGNPINHPVGNPVGNPIGNPITVYRLTSIDRDALVSDLSMHV